MEIGSLIGIHLVSRFVYISAAVAMVMTYRLGVSTTRDWFPGHLPVSCVESSSATTPHPHPSGDHLGLPLVDIPYNDWSSMCSSVCVAC